MTPKILATEPYLHDADIVAEAFRDKLAEHDADRHFGVIVEIRDDWQFDVVLYRKEAVDAVKKTKEQLTCRS